MRNDPPDVNALSQLLRAEYALDPASIEYLTEELLRLRAVDACRVICAALRAGAPPKDLWDNVARCILRSTTASPQICTTLLKQCSGRGMCPRAYRGRLRSLLRAGRPQPSRALASTASQQPPVQQERITPQRHSRPGRLVLDLADNDWAITSLSELLSRLASCQVSNRSGLTIRLGRFVYASALAILATWITRHNLVYNLDCPPETESYLRRMRFDEALSSPSIVVASDPFDWAVGLTRINKDVPTEVVSAKISEIIDTFIQPPKEDRDALVILIAEMIENVHRHGEPAADGYAVAQVYPKLLKLGITLVDPGMGVRGSFERGDPSVSIATCRSDEDFLRLALQLHATSKRGRHSGYGLYILSELVSRNRGTFLLGSGTCSLVGYQRNGRLHFDSYRHGPWEGTVVSAILDLYNRLPIGEVYAQMPPPPGFEREDFFGA